MADQAVIRGLDIGPLAVVEPTDQFWFAERGNTNPLTVSAGAAWDARKGLICGA